MTIKPVLYYDEERGYFSFDHDAAIKIGVNPSTPYRILFENGEFEFTPLTEIKTIYHYCSFETLQAIVQSGVFRMSNCRHCNDSEELLYSIRKLEELFQMNISEFKELNKQPHQLSEYFERLENLLQRLDFLAPEKLQRAKNDLDTLKKQSFKQQTTYLINCIEKVRPVFEDIQKNFSDIYITCFSKAKDSLSQWRGYGNEGKGVAIGFNVNTLSQLYNTYKVVLKEVIYHKNIQYEILNNGLLSYIHSPSTIRDWLYHILPVIKPLGFKEERECRLIYVPKEGGELRLEQAYHNNKMNYYYKIPLEKMGISEIIIGPKSKLSPMDIHHFLWSKGISIDENKIKNSELSYQ